MTASIDDGSTAQRTIDRARTAHWNPCLESHPSASAPAASLTVVFRTTVRAGTLALASSLGRLRGICSPAMALSLDDARRAYAEEIRAVSDIRCEALIEALARVAREDFLGPGPWLVLRSALSASLLRDTSQASIYRPTRDADPRQLYHNILIAIDPERGLHNGSPAGNLFWIDSLAPRAGDRVVHVGCGVGYYTAIIAEALGPTGSGLRPGGRLLVPLTSIRRCPLEATRCS